MSSKPPIFNSPPNWPAPPAGWTPPPDWQPDPAWGPPPAGWQLLTKPKTGNAKKIIVGAGIALVVLIVIAGIAGGSKHATQKTASNAAPTSQAPSQPTTTGATVTPSASAVAVTAVPVTPVPVTGALTASQEQAVSAAQGYLSLGGGFSRQGLIDQLSSSAGDSFSTADATVAVDSLNTDWDAQALLAAKGYLALGSGFSHAGLVEQLDSTAGDQFTPAQAEYGASHAGA